MATETKPCPVCAAPMPVHRDVVGVLDDGSGPECEYETTCPAGHYSYEHSYGAYRTTVGDREWSWGYDAAPDEYAALDAEIKAAIAALRYHNPEEPPCVPS